MKKILIVGTSSSVPSEILRMLDNVEQIEIITAEEASMISTRKEIILPLVGRYIESIPNLKKRIRTDNQQYKSRALHHSRKI